MSTPDESVKGIKTLGVKLNPDGGIVKTCGLGCFRRPPFRLIRPVRVV